MKELVKNTDQRQLTNMEDMETPPTYVRISVQAHGAGLPHENSGKCPAIRSMIIVDEEVGDQDHGLNGADRGRAEVAADTQRLIAGRCVKLGCLLSVGRCSGGHKLSANSEHGKEHANKCRIDASPALGSQCPKLLKIVVEVALVNHGIDGVDAFKVSDEEAVALNSGRQNRDDFWKTALAGPVVGKRMLGPNAKHVGRRGAGIGCIGEQSRGECHGAVGFGMRIEDAAVGDVWYRHQGRRPGVLLG